MFYAIADFYLFIHVYLSISGITVVGIWHLKGKLVAEFLLSSSWKEKNLRRLKETVLAT